MEISLFLSFMGKGGEESTELWQKVVRGDKQRVLIGLALCCHSPLEGTEYVLFGLSTDGWLFPLL